MDEKLKRVFIHELGHLIADTYNYKLFGLHQVEKIEFEAKKTRYGIDYIGRTILVKPDNYIEKNDKLINLPEKIASLVFGCYFQSIFQNNNFKNCFNHNDNSSNGYIDVSNLHYALAYFRVKDDVRRKLYAFLYTDFPDSLPKDKIIDMINKLDLRKLINQNGDIFEMKIDETLKISGNFLTEFEPIYIEFIKKIKEILKWVK